MGSKHNESRTDCNSCNCLTLLERKISTSTSALETEIIFNVLSLTAEIKENHIHLHTLIWMLDWTCLARCLIGPVLQEDSVWNFGQIKVEINMEHADIRRRLPCELDISKSRTKIWYQQNAFKAPSGLGCCPF